MLRHPFQAFPGQVEPVKIRIALFKFRQQAQAVQIMIKTAIGLHTGRQGIFPRMAKGWMAEIMRQRQGFAQILIQAQKATDRARYLRHFQRMGQPRAVIIPFMGHKNLGFVLETAKRTGMNDAVAVTLKGIADTGFGFRV